MELLFFYSITVSACISERDAMLLERSNMLSVLKLVVKQLIDSSLSQGCVLEDVQGPLLQFFTIMESMMCHGIKCENCYCLHLTHRQWSRLFILSAQVSQTMTCKCQQPVFPLICNNVRVPGPVDFCYYRFDPFLG